MVEENRTRSSAPVAPRSRMRTRATGTGGSAFGNGAWATGEYSTSVGHNSWAAEDDSVAIGVNSYANAANSVALGAMLFAASVLENVRYGRPEATREAVLAACERACALEFIERDAGRLGARRRVDRA